MHGEESFRGAETGRPDGVMVIRTQAMPRDTNYNGDVFGGWIMSQMDIGGGLLAKEVAQGRVVTVTVDKMVFARPVSVGDAICIYGQLLRIGNTSLDIRLDVWAKPLTEDFSADRQLVVTGVFRYVAIDADGRPRRIPDNARFPRSVYGEPAGPRDASPTT